MRSLRAAPEQVALWLLVTVYCAQIVTPLRLNFDSIILLSSAESASRGGGLLFHGQPTVFPPGYPALLSVLMRCGLAHVPVLIAINVVSVLVGLLAVERILREVLDSRRASVAVLCLSLLSAAVVQNVTVPLTDSLFFGIAMLTLLAIGRAASRLTTGKAVVCVVLVMLSISIRRTGLSLIGPLAWALLSSAGARRWLAALSAARKRAAISIAAAALGVIAVLIYRTSTLADAFLQIRLYGAGKALHAPLWRLGELGELVVNLPSSAFPGLASALPVIGAVFGALVAAGAACRRGAVAVGEVFLISYCACIVFWPFYSPRFWLPVVPLMIGYAWLTLRQLANYPMARYGACAYAVWAVLTGCIVLSSSTAVSFSGSRIGDLYRTGIYDDAYCAAGFCRQHGAAPPRDRKSVDRSGMATWWEEDAVRLLVEFREGKLARGGG